MAQQALIYKKVIFSRTLPCGSAKTKPSRDREIHKLKAHVDSFFSQETRIYKKHLNAANCGRIDRVAKELLIVQALTSLSFTYHLNNERLQLNLDILFRKSNQNSDCKDLKHI